MQVEPAQIRAALQVAAQLVARDGAAYLPAFLALEAEVEALAGRNSALERAVAMIGGGQARAA